MANKITPDTISGRKLRKAREEKGHTQLQAATKIGISQPYYSTIERGAVPPEHVRAKVAKHYGVTIVAPRNGSARA